MFHFAAAHPLSTIVAPPAAGATQGAVRWTLRAEGLALFAAAVWAYGHEGGTAWMFGALFFAPDLTFAAYLLGPRIGAHAYNAVHSTLLPLAIAFLGWRFGAPVWESVGWIGLAHVGFDRAAGYGLKYPTAFQHTHLSSR